MITTGKRYAPREIERYIDAVTEADIKRVAQQYLWDKDIGIAAVRHSSVRPELQSDLVW